MLHGLLKHLFLGVEYGLLSHVVLYPSCNALVFNVFFSGGGGIKGLAYLRAQYHVSNRVFVGAHLGVLTYHLSNFWDMRTCVL